MSGIELTILYTFSDLILSFRGLGEIRTSDSLGRPQLLDGHCWLWTPDSPVFTSAESKASHGYD